MSLESLKAKGRQYPMLALQPVGINFSVQICGVHEG